MGCLFVGGVPKKKDMRLVLLGIAGSGKTTFGKQMQIIHNGGFDPTQAINYRKILLTNILFGIKQLIETSGDGVSEQNRKKGRFLSNLEEMDAVWNEELAERIKTIWAEEAIQQAWRHNKESILVQMDYLMEHFDRYLSEDFVPESADILRARQRSTGENTSTFTDDENHCNWHLIDLGGQMSERSKWEAVFNTPVNAILFFIAIDEFDTINPEKSASTYPTKLALSLSVLDEVLDSEFVTKSQPTKIIFMNKLDLFTEKIKDENRFADFKKYLAYSDEQDVAKCTDHLKDVLMSKSKGEDDLLHIHVVCALDTGVMSKVTQDIKVSIITSSLKKMGII